MPDSLDPREWARFAEEDAGSAVALLSTSPRNAAYLVHQSAEKYLKAVLLRRGVRPPHTHSLLELLRLIDANLSVDALETDAAGLLDEIAPRGRYPGDQPEPTLEEAQALLRAGHTLRRYARTALGLEDTDA